MSDSTYWSKRLQTGTANGTGVVAEEGLSANRTKLNLTATPVTITHSTGAGYGSLKLYDFPVGRLQILDAELDLDLVAAAGISATATVKGSVGTTATANATLAGTEVNLIPEASVALVASAGALTSEATTVELAAGVFDGTVTAMDLILNFGLASGVTTDSTITCNGVIAITWINHGDV